MKKNIALITLIFLLTAFFACTPSDDTQIKVGFLSGPTGIGMSKMINDYGGEAASEQYDFIKYTAPNNAMVDLKEVGS